MHSKDLLELCQRHGIDVRNQLSTLDQDQRDQVVELVKRGASAPPSTSSKPVAPAKLPTEHKKVATLESRRPIPQAKPVEPPAPPVPEPLAPVVETPSQPAAQAEP